MGSPITISGFNSIDFNQILNAVMTQERAPLTRLQTEQSTLKSQNTAFGTLAGKLTTFQTAVEALQEEDSLAFLSASSSDSGVGVTSTGGTVPGTYDIVVTTLAKGQVTAASTEYNAVTDVAATGGSLTLTPANGDPATVITVTASTTLEELAARINDDDDSPASATVMQTAPGVYKLVLTGRDTGADNAFTITNALTGGTPPAFAANSQTAIDAAFTVNGLSVTSASNTVTDVISGATITLTKADPDTTVTVSVARDFTKSKDALKKFITSYNDIATFAKDQAAAATAGQASIGRDPLLKGLRSALRDASMAEYAGGTYTRLAEIGVGFDVGGKMILNDTVFDDAMAAAPADVQTLVSGASGEGGAFGAMALLAEDYAKSGGLVSGVRQRITDQVSALNTRLDTLSARLEQRRLALQQQYTAADMAMTRLKSQSSSLSAVGGGYRLF